MPSVSKDPLTRTAPQRFEDRHIGPRESEIGEMLASLDLRSLDELVERALPAAIRLKSDLDLPPAKSEAEILEELRRIAGANRVGRSLIGMGYSECTVPAAIQRGILENPGWYTAYTPYQAEISQGRLEALLNFQTVISDLTGLPVANASLLDEATAAAEAMTLCRRAAEPGSTATRFCVLDGCHPQTVAVLETRAGPLGIELVAARPQDVDSFAGAFGVLVQYPTTDGRILDYGPLCRAAHDAGARVVVAADLLALTLLRPPSEFGADIVVGSSQRFGVPLGYGGPHAAFMATRDELKRQIPGRLVGVSRDADGRPALRLALQTREQHIRRDKATSNICTAQVLLAVMASMYAVYHGPQGLRRIASGLRRSVAGLAEALTRLGCRVADGPWFDTLRVAPGPRKRDEVVSAAARGGINLRSYSNGEVGIALGEGVTPADLDAVCEAFGATEGQFDLEALADQALVPIPAPHRREGDFLTHPVFHRYHSETELMRYMHRLASRDLSLDTSMIPLGSCTMKLNAAAEMLSVTLPGFAAIHPFAPRDQTPGYRELVDGLSRWLSAITGLPGVSLMPNAGAQGEYAGLLAIRAFHASRGESRRDVCLIPQSAHGTNPASAVMAGLRVVVVKCDAVGNIDVADLSARADEHRDRLAALMVTYPSTHGVFEETIVEVDRIVHERGGQVYLDGANMNALVGLCLPGEIGIDVCHLNLHKTFCIPHGGGGPGMGPICVASHLIPFLPSQEPRGEHAVGPVSAAPYGSPSILPIPYAYIAMMGPAGLRRASQVAILAANYVARRLEGHYPVLYRGKNGLVAHECILDARPFRESAGIDAEDIAKRLMDYGFHAPTMSWPVANTLMVEPTESESKRELDRFCEAMIAIRAEIREVESGVANREDNPLKNAPHTALAVASAHWSHPYSRETAAFPAPWLHDHKYWPPVARVDNAHGDRNLVCSCPPVSAYAEPEA
jgi:glycine dehydrogenase